MALYTQTSKDRVRDAVDMTDLVGAKVELRRAGVNRLVGLCPFHDERSPSFGIDPVQKLYHCFGCGEGGDAFKFVMETEGVDFKGALELLADRYNVTLELEEEDPRDAERRRRRDRLLELMERTATYYVRLLWEAPEAEGARAYLAGRNLEEGTLREFRVGYAPDTFDRVLSASRKAGFGDQDLEEAGLIRRRKGRIFDAFNAQITFPLTDTRGRVLGFAGRTLKEGDQRPKYLNSPEGELFHKRRQLFGADLARAAAAKKSSVIVAEGYTDVIALHQAGLRNTVAIMGTSMTEDQVTELARLAPTVQLALDADGAGQAAMIRAARVAAGRKLELRVVQMPAGEDPADLVARVGAEEVEKLVAASIPFVRFRVLRELATGDLTSAEGKDRVLANLGPVLGPLGPSVQREELLQIVADRLDVSPDLVASLLAGAPQALPDPVEDDGAAPEPRAVAPRPVLGRREQTERAFLIKCIALPEAGEKELEALDLDADFTADATRELAAHLKGRLAAPADGLAEDSELAQVIRALSVRAQGAQARADEVHLERLQLQLARVERDITTARRAGEGGVSALAARRGELQAELHEAMQSR